MADEPTATLHEAVRGSGLLAAGSRVVALVSGGPDSACLAAGAAAHLGAAAVTGLHLNYGLRPDSGEDEEACRALCRRLGVRLEVERPRLPPGNVQAAARDVRYAAAERLRAHCGATAVATGHTLTDVAETLLYRLAASPGRRALLGLAPRRGTVVRPLLALTRAEARELALAAALPFRDDPSNRDRRFARVRVREEVLPVLRELNPAAERNIAATRAELAEEADALEQLARDALRAAGAADGAVPAAPLAELHPALRRLALRRLAEDAAGRAVALDAAAAADILRLAALPEGGEVQLGGGLRAHCEGGLVRIAAAGEAPAPATLPVPGSCRFGEWELRAELRSAPVEPRGPELATLDAQALGNDVEVRGWRDGDRMRPLGLGGGKSLQDLFTDGGVPRSLRRTLPVVVARGRIAWVAGVAVGEEFKLRPDSAQAAVLTASRVARGV